jgi:hypothetical protein
LQKEWVFSDVITRQDSAVDMAQMLKTGKDNFKFVFVMTLEAGRVRPEDIVTVDLVLDAIASVTCIKPRYGVIVNKMSDKFMSKLDEENRQKLLNSLNANRGNPTKFLHFLERRLDLEDEENVFFQPDEVLFEFLQILPLVISSSNIVPDIEVDKIEKLMKAHAEELKKLQEDNNAMKEQMKRKDEEYKQQVLELNMQHCLVVADLKKRETEKEKICNNFLAQNQWLQADIVAINANTLAQLSGSQADASQCRTMLKDVQKQRDSLLAQKWSQVQKLETEKRQLERRHAAKLAERDREWRLRIQTSYQRKLFVQR